MRSALLLAAALAVTAASTLPAEAVSIKRKDGTVITIRPRSYLDAGKDVSVGSKNNYVYDTTPYNANPFRGFVGYGDEPIGYALRTNRGIPVDFSGFDPAVR